jgi:hypothetical protein
MNLKQKLINAVATHPRLVTFGISFGIATALAIGLAVATSGSGGDHLAYAIGKSYTNTQTNEQPPG